MKQEWTIQSFSLRPKDVATLRETAHKLGINLSCAVRFAIAEWAANERRRERQRERRQKVA